MVNPNFGVQLSMCIGIQGCSGRSIVRESKISLNENDFGMLYFKFSFWPFFVFGVCCYYNSFLRSSSYCYYHRHLVSKEKTSRGVCLSPLLPSSFPTRTDKLPF